MDTASGGVHVVFLGLIAAVRLEINVLQEKAEKRPAKSASRRGQAETAVPMKY
jgi:hypothetical protein